MEVEITRYKGIVNAFNNPKALAKLIIVVSLIIFLVFAGITIIALVVKSYYPYRAVNSNKYGATVIQNEDEEIIYWLFNSADLWANSGVHVKKGDVISVRASGAFHSSIHHLVEEAGSNKMLRKWVNPIGGPNSSGPRDESRASYRVSQACPFNTLLMQVIPEEVELRDRDGVWNLNAEPYLDGKPKEVKNKNGTLDRESSIVPDIYAIGAERDKITIRNDGVLHFTVNDIVLTKNILFQMKQEVKMKDGEDTGSLELGRFFLPDETDASAFNAEIKSLIEGLEKLGYKGQENDFLIQDSRAVIPKQQYEKWNKDYKRLYDTVQEYDSGSRSYITNNFTELDYYLIRNFVDAWYVDNVGSFLIVIERKKQ